MPGTPDIAMPQTILAFDFGRRRIGVAVGQSITGSASPLGIVENRDTGPDQEKIAALIKEWRPGELVVGMPSQADGSPSAIHDYLMKFIESLATFNILVETVDERFTSAEAEAKLKAARVAGTRGRISKESIDSAAAVIIAERYLAARKN